MHNIMNEFAFRPDRTTDYRVSCPWTSKKYPHWPYNGENGVSTFSLLFLIGSFWYFHVTRTSIKAWMSSNFLKWDLTMAHWTKVSDRCPLGYLFFFSIRLVVLLCHFWTFFQLSDCKSMEPSEQNISSTTWARSWYLAYRLCPKCRWPD